MYSDHNISIMSVLNLQQVSHQRVSCHAVNKIGSCLYIKIVQKTKWVVTAINKTIKYYFRHQSDYTQLILSVSPFDKLVSHHDHICHESNH